MIGIFGGSFDPIHNGHLRAALEVRQRLNLDKIIFIPCQQHAFGKTFYATATQRLQMLELAIIGQENFAIDPRELNRPGISYTVDTLIELAAEAPEASYSLILGMDALLTLQQWHRWQEILTLTNIIAVNRPNITSLAELEVVKTPLTDFLCTNQQEFRHSKAGKIFLLSAPLLDISATYIRNEIAAKKSVEYLVPEKVARYIAMEKFYAT